MNLALESPLATAGQRRTRSHSRAVLPLRATRWACPGVDSKAKLGKQPRKEEIKELTGKHEVGS